jgi:5-methylcytosine-specific restriction enzyme subunit McrC
MRIPIRNIYYMLCYAWDRLEERDTVDVDPVEGDNVLDLLAKVLLNGLSHLLKRGLDRGYVNVEEDTRCLRGKVDLTASIKRDLLRQGQAHCVYDDLSHDIKHNQILRSTLALLVRANDLESGTKERCQGMRRRLQDVSEIPLTHLSFRSVQLNRQTNLYDFLLKTCELIVDGLLPTEETGRSRFRAFEQDEVKMRGLFEAFVRNFLKRKQDTYRVGVEWIKWDAHPANESAARLLPGMRTDVSLESPDRYIIIDTKFTPNALRTRFERESLHSPNLYQLHAYISNKRSSLPQGTRLTGILVYPEVGSTLDLKYEFPQMDIQVMTVDLAAEHGAIHDRLLQIVGIGGGT